MVDQCAHDSPGEAAEGGKNQRQQAGEIMACEYPSICGDLLVPVHFTQRSSVARVLEQTKQNKNEHT
jgi:hypothetical protein